MTPQTVESEIIRVKKPEHTIHMDHSWFQDSAIHRVPRIGTCERHFSVFFQWFQAKSQSLWKQKHIFLEFHMLPRVSTL